MNKLIRQTAKKFNKGFLIFSIGIIWILLIKVLPHIIYFDLKENLLLDLLLNLIMVSMISILFSVFVKKAKYKKESLIKLFTEDENRYQVLFENANDSIVILKHTVVIDCNNKSLEIFRCNKEQLIGKSILELSPEFQTNGISSYDSLQRMNKDIISGKLKRFQWRHKRMDNTEFDADISLNTIIIEEEKFRVSIIRDITKIIEAEQALRKSEEKYRLIAENVNDLIWKMDMDLRYIYLSPSVYKLRGYTVEEAMKMPINEITDPASYKIMRDLLEEKTFQLKNNDQKGYEPIILETEQYHKNGSALIVQINAQVVKNKHDNTFEIIGITRDITEKKKSELELKEQEERYKRLSDVAFEGIFFHNKGIVEDTNKSFTKILGYKKEEVIGKDIFSFLISESSTDMVMKNLKKLDGVFYEAEFIAKTGKLVPVEIEAQNYNEKGKQMRVVAFRDISERKKMQHKILQTIINTEEQERSRVAKELHDGLGPLLSASKIYLNVLTQNPDEERKLTAILRLAETIEESIYSVQEISNNLSPHILQNFGLTEAIESFCIKLNNMAKINIDIQSNLNVRINKEVEITLYRVIVELVNNSLKHADADEININIDYGIPLLKVTYDDNGKGFDVDLVMQNMTGMGMFNIFNRIESINGKINVNSKPGNGLKVKIQIIAL